MKTALVILALISGAAALVAQSFAVDWFTVDGGGGTSTGGVYSITGAIGQPAADTLRGGNFTVVSGFGGFHPTVQPEMLMLSVERQAGDVRVFWPKPAIGSFLEQSLTVTGVWSQVSSPYLTNATDISITVPTSGGTRFYRLRKP